MDSATIIYALTAIAFYPGVTCLLFAFVNRITESTVKVHRTNLMRRMKARSLPELSRMADILKLTQEEPRRS